MCWPEDIEYQRSAHEYGLDDVVTSVDIWVADDLYVVYGSCLRCGFLSDYGCHVLIDVLRQHGLQHHEVYSVFFGFHDTQIVNITIAVEVEVTDTVFTV